MLSKTSLSIAAAGAGLCFLGYCIYFDKKRRNDPNFRQKLREKRRNASKKKSSGDASTTKFPDLTNQEACQTFFIQEIQLGELLLSNGQTDEGIEHLANALIVCGQPQHLLGVFSQTLPAEVVQKLTLRLPIVQKRVMEQQMAKMGVTEKPTAAKVSPVIELTEDDVE